MTPRPGRSSPARSSPEYRSTQSIALPDLGDSYAAWGEPPGLISMLHEYFSVAELSASGLARVRWHGEKPVFLLRWPPVLLLSMGEPSLELSADRRAITVGLEGGLLVEPNPQSSLTIALERGDGSVHALVDLVAYRPRGGQYRVIRWLYQQTQARVHSAVGRRYLRQFRHRWPRSREQD